MNRPVKHLAFTSFAASLTLGTALLTGACSSADGKTNERAAPPVVAVSAIPVDLRYWTARLARLRGQRE